MTEEGQQVQRQSINDMNTTGVALFALVFISVVFAVNVSVAIAQLWEDGTIGLNFWVAIGCGVVTVVVWRNYRAVKNHFDKSRTP